MNIKKILYILRLNFFFSLNFILVLTLNIPFYEFLTSRHNVYVYSLYQINKKKEDLCSTFLI